MVTLLKMIESKNDIVMVAALQTLSKIVRSTPMRPCWTNFLELILLKIIDSYKGGKEVSVNNQEMSGMSTKLIMICRFNVKLMLL